MKKRKRCLAETKIKVDAILDLKLAMQNEAYHRKQMEYFKEEIKILKDIISRSGD